MLPVFCLIFKLFNISSITFLAAKTNQNEKKITPPSLDCQGLPENAFQVNQLYNVTWSNVQIEIELEISHVSTALKRACALKKLFFL